MPTVLQFRGPCVESEHPFSAVAVHAGQVVWQAGDDPVTTWRSAAKPLQLATALEILGDPELAADWLAVGAASHSAEPDHLQRVRAILAHFGAPEAGLRCGAHPPIHVPSAEAVLRAGEPFSDIHNNCSGKHAFMLAASLQAGWDADYRPPEHPLQRTIFERVTGWCGVEPHLAIDGCGVPTFCLPLSAIARGWAAIATAMATGNDSRLQAIGWAMARHPELTSGTDRFDLTVVRAASEPMAVKIGAQGVFCLALPQRQLGVAIKVKSGVSEALGAALAAVLPAAAPGAWVEPEAWPFRQVRNVVGRLVGSYQSDVA